MTRRLAVLVLAVAALGIVPLARGAYPVPYAAQGGEGVLSKDGAVRYVAVGVTGGGSTIIKAISRSDGSTMKSQTLSGSFGIPMLTYKGPAGGLFRDGSALVVANPGYTATSQFVVLGAQDLTVRETIELKGTFAFDALSPDGSMLYLIQHTTQDDLQHYVVRAYDLNAQKLLPGRIADRTQKNWVMQGWPVSRVESPDGRWHYTLYANPGGYPFIHALDSVKGVAHCVGIAWKPTDSTQNALMNYAMKLRGASLVVTRQGGAAYRLVNTTTWKVSKPKR